MLQRCNKNIRLVVVFNSAGARKITVATGQFTERSVVSIFMRNDDGFCMLASLVNAIWALLGGETTSLPRRKI